MYKDFEKLFPPIDHADLAARLRRPKGMVDVILDTDTYNEIDDQFALSYLVRSEEKIRVKAITAAPFYRDPATSNGINRSTDPGDGMEKSYNEIFKLLDLLDRPDLKNSVYRGSTSYLSGPFTPVVSQAAEEIVRISQDYNASHQLYIVAIAALTNVASALLMDPTLRERSAVIWLGGHSFQWGLCDDFNMIQDLKAARLLFDCGIPFIQFPMLGVVSEFRFSKPELEYWFRGKNDLCDYLIDNTYKFAKLKYNYEGWSKPLWDVTTVAWLLEGDYLADRMVPSPIPRRDHTYSFYPDRHPIKYVYYIKKDPLIADIAHKLTAK